VHGERYVTFTESLVHPSALRTTFRLAPGCHGQTLSIQHVRYLIISYHYTAYIQLRPNACFIGTSYYDLISYPMLHIQ